MTRPPLAVVLASVVACGMVASPAECVELRKGEGSPLWEAKLTSREVNDLNAAATAVAGQVGEPSLAAAIAATGPYAKMLNLMGGRTGVRITGVLPSSQLVVTPDNASPYNNLARARSGVRGSWDRLGRELQKSRGGVSSELKELWTLFHGQRPEGRGFAKVVANRARQRLDLNRNHWEKFQIIWLGGRDLGKVAIFSRTGFLQHNASNFDQVRCDGPTVGTQEKWQLIHNNDQTVSLRSFNGNYLRWGDRRGYELDVPRSRFGEKSKFKIAANRDGTVGIYRHHKESGRCHVWLTVDTTSEEITQYEYQDGCQNR